MKRTIKGKVNLGKATFTPMANVKQLDDIILELDIYSNSVPLDITQQTISLYAKRSNKTTVEQLDNITKDTTRVTINVKNSCFAILGITEMELRLVDDTGSISTSTFYITVDASLSSEESINAKNEIAILDEAKIEEPIRQANEDIRVSNENTRVSNEIERTEAEELRKQNEIAREMSYKEITDARVDFDGAVHDSLNERLTEDMTQVMNRFNNASLLDYSGESITANESYEGMTEELTVNGRTLQNLFKPDTAIAGNEIVGYWSISNTHSIVDVGGKTITLINPTNKKIRFNIRNLDGSASASYDISPFYKTIVALESFKKISAIAGLIADGWTEANKTELKGMILEGDWTNKEIPPYFEGIRSVGEINFIDGKYIGKNLFNKETDIINDWFIEGASGTYKSIPGAKSVIVKASVGKQYRLSKNGGDRVIYGFFSGIPTLNTVALAYGSSDKTTVAPTGTEYLIWYIANVGTPFPTDVQIEEGTVASTPYEDYYEGCRIKSISFGKNLLKENLINGTATITKVDEGFKIEWVSGFGTVMESYTGSLCKVKRNTNYTLSFYSRKLTGLVNVIVRNNEDTASIANKPQVDSTVSVLHTLTFNTGDNDNVMIRINRVTETGSVIINNFQLEEGTTSTTYEPYQEHRQPITLTTPLRGLPNNVRDIVDFKRGAVVRNVGKVVLNGSENWSSSANELINTLRFQAAIPNATILAQPVSNFPVLNNTTYGIDLENMQISTNGNLIIRVLKSKLTTLDVAGLKAWLQANPVTVYYQLETPIEEPIANLTQLRTYDKVTNVFTNGSLINPTIITKVPTNVNSVIKTLQAVNARLTMVIQQNSLNTIALSVDQESRLTKLELGVI